MVNRGILLGRVQVRTRTASAGAQVHAQGTPWRLRIEQQLVTASLTPPGLPPSAVLLVRTMVDPQPGIIGLGVNVHRVKPGWEQAVRDRLAAFLGQASRPTAGYVAADAVAVLFADEAEMLACLLLDLSQGIAQQRWWWRTLLLRLPYGASSPLVEAVRLRPSAAPAALALLYAWGHAKMVVDRLGDHGAMQTLTIMTAVQNLDLSAELDAIPRPLADHGTEMGAPNHHKRSQTSASLDASQDAAPDAAAALVAAPWISWMLETPSSSWTPAQQALLGIALGLHQHAHEVHSPAFRRRLRQWRWQIRGSAQPTTAASSAAADGNPGKKRSDLPREPQSQRTPSAAATNAAGRQNGARSRAQPSGAEGSERGNSDADQTEKCLSPIEDLEQREEAASWTTSVLVAEPQTSPPAAPTGMVNASSWQFDQMDGGIVTELGGVLFLINLMQRLMLPDCFIAQWRTDPVLGSWATLELIARGLLANEASASVDDELWSLLARLDGRDVGALPGERLPTAIRYVLPTSWRHEANLKRSAPAPALSETLDRPLTHGLGFGARRWLAFVLPSVGAWLEAALGPEADIVPELLLRRARIHAAPSHVDLMLTLADASTAVRLAGLDQDPGWLPLLGRVVLFHFD